MTCRCQVRRADQPADRKQEVPFSTHLAASYCLALIMVSSMVLLTRVLMSDVKALRASDRVSPLLDRNFWASAFTPNSTWQRHKKRARPHSATPTDPNVLFPLPVILKKTRSETYNQGSTEMFFQGRYRHLAFLQFSSPMLMINRSTNSNGCTSISSSGTTENIFKTHVQCWCFDAELAEGVPQGLLGNCKLSELIGQRLSQLGDVFVTLSVVFEQLKARLQVQIHRTRSSTELLRQSLPGILQGQECCCWSDQYVLIRSLIIEQQ